MESDINIFACESNTAAISFKAGADQRQCPSQWPHNAAAAAAARISQVFFEADGDLLDLRAMLGFERWQSGNKGLPLGSVIDHMCGIDCVEAS